MINFGSTTLIQKYQHRKQSGLEVGIQAAQVLMNKKKRAQLQQEILQAFPILPESFVDVTLGIVSEAFQAVLPKDLQSALKPGGMETFRLRLRQAMVDTALKQDTVQQVPILSNADKANMLGFVVDLALDHVLEDFNWVLQAPEVRLRTLHEEIRQIRATEMTRGQVAWFYFRRQPARYTALAALTLFLLYAQVCHGGSWKYASAAAASITLQSTKVVAAGMIALAKTTLLRLWIFVKVVGKIIVTSTPSYGAWKHLPLH